MGEILCPACGCVMDEYIEEKWTGKYHNVMIVEVERICTCCEYTETTYED